MAEGRIAVVGVGATGSVIAAALLGKRPDTILVDPRQGLRESLLENGLTVDGPLSFKAPVKNVRATIPEMKDLEPDVIFLCTKTFNLVEVVEEIAAVYRPGVRVVSTHNGLGTEDAIADRFGPAAALRMILNYGVAVKGPGHVETAFFNPPNQLGAIVPETVETAKALAALLTEGGLATECVEDIRLYVWKKMIMKCTMASICAVTDRTIQGALNFAPTREIAEGCFQEILAVAKGMGYDLGPDYMDHALAYLEKVGVHKDSMCHDFAAKMPTEIDFLGGKVVEYGKRLGIPTPFYTTMSNLVRALQDSYLNP